MSNPTSFTQFASLPPELRFQIWTEALSVWSVWATVGDGPTERDLSAKHAPLTMKHVGPAPYLAGLSSREARRLLTQICKRLHGPNADTYWVNLDKTVIYLGDSAESAATLGGSCDDHLSGVEHVALRWCQNHWGGLARTCQRLAKKCPSLRTIIVQRCEIKATTNVAVDVELDPKTASNFTTIVENNGPDSTNVKLDIKHLRALLLEYFGDSPLRLHFIGTDTADSSS